jgi:hypothetical protein
MRMKSDPHEVKNPKEKGGEVSSFRSKEERWFSFNPNPG